MAHNNPRHLKLLVDSLSTENVLFFIHVDLKVEMSQFLQIRGENISFIEQREKVYWGDYSQVQAVLNLSKAAIQSNHRVQRLVLLSGVDLPLYQSSKIEEFFAKNNDKQFIRCIPMERDGDKPLSRLSTYQVNPRFGRLATKIHSMLRKIGILPTVRDYQFALDGLKPYGGSTWWSLTADAMKAVFLEIENRPILIKFYKNTQMPDEMFFQTFLAHTAYGNKIEPNLTYTDWSQGGANPARIGETHLEMFVRERKICSQPGSSSKLFARKFSDDGYDLSMRFMAALHRD